LVPSGEKRARVFAAVVFVLVGFFAVAVGAHDAFAAVEVGSRFGGLLLLLAGLALLAATVALAIPELKWAPTAAIFVAPAGVLVGLSFIVAQLIAVDRDRLPVWAAILIAALVVAVAVHRALKGSGKEWTPPAVALVLLVFAYLYFLRGEHDEWVIVWAAIAIASGLVAYQLWMAQPPDLSGLSLRVVFGVFGVFSLGALVSGAQLWYTSQYVPAHQPPSLTIESRLHQLRDANGLEVARLTFTVSNTSQAQARVLGSVYRVSGSNMESPTHATDAKVAHQLRRPEINGLPVLRYRRDTDRDLVQTGRIFPEGFWLDPDEKFSTSALVYIPYGRYDVLRSQAELLIAKGGSLTIDLDRDVRRFAHLRGEWGAEARWPIDETSWFRDLTRADRTIGVRWVAGANGYPLLDGYPYLETIVWRDGEDAPLSERIDYSEQAERLYGMASTESTTEIPLRHRDRRS
jgi:hypothetical protein